MRPTIHRLVHGVVLVTLILSAGCGKEQPSQPTADNNGPGPKTITPGTTPPVTPTPGGGSAVEDPEVAAHFKAKRWSQMTDMRLSDGKKLLYLSVENPDRSFDDVTLTPEDYKMIGRSRATQVLDFRRVLCKDEDLKALVGMPRLEGILLNCKMLTDQGMKTLAQCKNLDNVNILLAENLTDEGIKELAALPRLHTLYIMSMKLDGSAFEAFADSKTLRSVMLELVDGFTDEGAKQLAKHPHLDELKIKSGFGEKKLTAAGIKAIVDVRMPAKFEFDEKLIDDDLLAALIAKGWLYGPTPPGATRPKPATAADVKYVSLDGSKITDKGIDLLLDCPNITALHLQKTGVTDESLKKFNAFKNLDYLALEQTKVTAEGLNAIAGLPIKHLAMQGCELTEDCFKAFGKMSALEELWLSDAKMQADWLKHIAKLPKVKDLNLMRADFDDAAVKHMASLTSLEDLTLNNTNLGDEGFLQLLKLPKLKRLYVDGTKVTKEVYLKAKKDHPKVRFYYYRYDS